MSIAVALAKPNADRPASSQVRLRRCALARLSVCILGVVCVGTLAGCDRGGRGLTTYQAAGPNMRHTATSAGSKTSIPLPDRELLVRQPEPDCEFKANEADADGLRKLDYERQCYRHSDMIARGRLELLQNSVDKTIKAVSRGERNGS
jgi:hypothetical protein